MILADSARVVREKNEQEEVYDGKKEQSAS